MTEEGVVEILKGMIKDGKFSGEGLKGIPVIFENKKGLFQWMITFEK